MAENHRRVESRTIIGTGMATDPERLQRVADEAERHTRTWRESPEETFGQVLGRAPAKGELDDAPPPKTPKADTNDGANTSADDRADDNDGDKSSPPKTPAKVSLRAPDPRARLLHAALDRKNPVPTTAKATTSAPTTDTPATGTAGMKTVPRPK